MYVSGRRSGEGCGRSGAACGSHSSLFASVCGGVTATGGVAVTKDWVYDCKAQKTKLPVAPYLVPLKKTGASSSSPHASPTSALGKHSSPASSPAAAKKAKPSSDSGVRAPVACELLSLNAHAE